MNSRVGFIVVSLSLLAGCGGGGSPPPGPTMQGQLQASPASIQVNNLTGKPETQSISITGASDLGAHLLTRASDLSFMSMSVQSTSSSLATLNVTLYGAGSSTVTVADARGASVTIPITSVPCGRPNSVQYVQLISPPDGAKNVSSSTAAFYVQVAGFPQITTSPFNPLMNVHFVVNGTSTIDPVDRLAVATPPSDAVIPTPMQTPGGIGYESGPMPQLSPGNSYTVYTYDDTCEGLFKAGTFST